MGWRWVSLREFTPRIAVWAELLLSSPECIHKTASNIITVASNFPLLPFAYTLF